MFHPFIEDYFKNNLDSIKNFHIKVNNKENNKSNLKNNDDYTIYFEDNIYYAVKDNDITTYKHLTMFSILIVSMEEQVLVT